MNHTNILQWTLNFSSLLSLPVRTQPTCALFVNNQAVSPPRTFNVLLAAPKINDWGSFYWVIINDPLPLVSLHRSTHTDVD